MPLRPAESKWPDLWVTIYFVNRQSGGDLSEMALDDLGNLVGEAESLLDRAVELRRKIHRRPEIGLVLPETQATVLAALEPLGLKTFCGNGTTSVIAVLEGGKPGPTTLLRGDMDALPMPEDTGLDFASEIPNAMHACGHDAHVAMLVGAVTVVSGRKSSLKGRVVFMFQPGEEGYGGAKLMLEEGLVEKFGQIDRAFAIHVTPQVPSGMIVTRPGTLMASADEFRIVVQGRGGHASMPHDAVDPIPVACEIVLGLQAMVTRRVPVFDPTVVTISTLKAGTASNVIPETVELTGTMRAVSDSTRAYVLQRVKEVVEGIASAHLCTAQLTLEKEGYPVTVNDSEQAARTLQVARDLLGPARVIEAPSPVMGAEDWSYVLQKVPGSMAFLGVAPAGVEAPAPNHSNRMLIDEHALSSGIAMYSAMALC